MSDVWVSRNPEARDDVTDLLDRLTDSEMFRNAPVMRSLLLYLWQQQGKDVSEYAVAVDALGRPPDFDPKTDATVRVQVARLRTKLKEFYAKEGASFPLRLSIPLGGHDLRWSYEVSPDTLPAPVALAPPPAQPRRALAALCAVSLVLFLAVCGLLLRNRSLERSIAAPRPPLPGFWRAFVANGKPTAIVVPNPLHFAWPDQNIYLRDKAISEFADWPSSPHVRDIARKLGPPTLLQPFVGTFDMLAGVKLLQFLQNERQDVELLGSRNLPSDSFGTQNTIFIGLPRNTLYLKQVLGKTNFYIASTTPVQIRSRSPKAAEPVEYEETRDATDRRMVPGIVVFLPTRPEGTRSMILLGTNPTTLTSLLVPLEGSKLLDQEWVKAGSPEAWETVVLAEVYRGTVLNVRPVAFREIPATFWK